MLAMNELRISVGLLARKYTMRFPEHYKSTQVLDDMKDCFVSIPGELRLIFEVRKDTEE